MDRHWIDSSWYTERSLDTSTDHHHHHHVSPPHLNLSWSSLCSLKAELRECCHSQNHPLLITARGGCEESQDTPASFSLPKCGTTASKKNIYIWPVSVIFSLIKWHKGKHWHFLSEKAETLESSFNFYGLSSFRNRMLRREKARGKLTGLQWDQFVFDNW